jgi:hypothetical protein
VRALHIQLQLTGMIWVKLARYCLVCTKVIIYKSHCELILIEHPTIFIFGPAESCNFKKFIKFKLPNRPKTSPNLKFCFILKHIGRNPRSDRILASEEDVLLEDVLLEDVLLEDVLLEDVLLEDIF